MLETSSGAYAALTAGKGSSVLAGLFQWFSVGLGSGTVGLLALAEANPEVVQKVAEAAPTLNTSINTLILAVVAFVIKSYVPSEKKVDKQFESQTSVLLTKLEAFAFDTRGMRADMREHKNDVREWKKEAKQDSKEIKDSLVALSHRVGEVERMQKQNTGEIKRNVSHS